MVKNSKRGIIGLLLLFALLFNIYIVLGTKAAYAEKDSPKQRVCAFIGCPNGKKLCATTSGDLEIPRLGKISVTYYCYEPE